MVTGENEVAVRALAEIKSGKVHVQVPISPITRSPGFSYRGLDFRSRGFKPRAVDCTSPLIFPIGLEGNFSLAAFLYLSSPQSLATFIGYHRCITCFISGVTGLFSLELGRFHYF